MRVTVTNHGPEAADLHLLPHLWARNLWSWDKDHPKPSLALEADGTVRAERKAMPLMRFTALQEAEWLFCDNETNERRLFGTDGGAPFPKDGIADAVVSGGRSSVNPDHVGTKCAALSRLHLAPGETIVLRFRFALADAGAFDAAAFDVVVAGADRRGRRLLRRDPARHRGP